MKKNRKYLVIVVLLLASVLFYFFKSERIFEKHKHVFVDTVLAEDEEIVARYGNTLAVDTTGDSQNTTKASADASALFSEKSSPPPASVVLFEKTPSPPSPPLQYLINPVGEFEKLIELKATPFNEIRSSGNDSNGTLTIYPGDSMEDTLALDNYYFDKSSSVNMWLAVTKATGVIEEISCLNIKGQVYYYKDDTNGFDIRYDGLRNVTVMVDAKFYLKLRLVESAYALEGHLYSMEDGKQLKEVVPITLIATDVRLNKMDMNACIAK